MSRCGSRRLRAKLLEAAGTEAEALTDEYISTEHLLLAMLGHARLGAAGILLEARADA